MDVLRDEVTRAGEPGFRQRILVGGGLKAEHVAPLKAAGIDGFHVGGAVRVSGWDSPIDPGLVQEWRRLVG
jgi:copper homeostasis protein